MSNNTSLNISCKAALIHSLCAQALPILKGAWDLGINTIDTANMYSNGNSERIIRVFMEKASVSPIHEQSVYYAD